MIRQKQLVAPFVKAAFATELPQAPSHKFWDGENRQLFAVGQDFVPR